MILLRTDGGGSSNYDERLKVVEKYLKYVYKDELQNKIFKLHDHKGCLSVYWLIKPSKQDITHLESIWNACCEYDLTHYITKFNEIDPLFCDYEINKFEI